MSDQQLPTSYSSLPFRHIKVEHVPASSPTPTPVLLIKLHRPEKLNAFTFVMQDDLELVYRLVDKDPRVKCLVLTGSGKSMCAGMDLQLGFGKDAESSTQERERNADHRDSGGQVVLAIHQCSKPTIAAINGAAVGVGITMCLPAAIRVAYAKAKIGFVFSQRGIVMEACSSFFLPRLIGHSRSLFLTTTGGVYTADSPHFGPLFAEVLPTPEATVQRALELANQVANNTSIVSTKLMRDLMYRGPLSAEETHLLDSRILDGIHMKKDNSEGVQSFLEKRPARFEGALPADGPDVYPWWTPVDTSKVSPVNSKGGSSKL
ncbi:hypothetical protein PV10_01576 [Exophiala mesophila]|uniref:Enoyl-CoA hydratase n=1 Tax=Exophiala mesophila TaxID=212818 RepID=A0A0D1X7N4_EXOME|nr:uncharacterized protein PV10_01576 [Exophiala mesophila]KIV97875.1 hypothetical protein PV10_01576 [Exophiala mesophila]